MKTNKAEKGISKNITQIMGERFSNTKKHPRSFPGYRGSDSPENSKEIARRIAELMIELQRMKNAYPEYFQDVDPEDPDLDLERGFPTFNRLIQQAQEGDSK